MVNKNNIQEWVKALRSGDYEQIDGALRINEKYCCLGVACDIALKSGDLTDDYRWETSDRFGTEEDFYSTALPSVVVDWLGLKANQHDPMLVSENGEEAHSASNWNDGQQASFNDIADMIEGNFLKEYND